MILRPRILFIANAGPAVGGGHVMRSLSLARALGEHGAECVFLAPPVVAGILDAFAPDMGRETVASVAAADLPAAVAGLGFDAVVFDHYGLGRADHQFIAQGRPTLVIDDLADRPLAADVVLDSGPARTEEDYADLAGGARLLLGPRYAPLRPEFAALREAAIARRGGPVQRVLVALGLTDVGGVTSRVLDRLRQRNGHLAFDVVLGSEAPSLPGLTRVAAHDPRVMLHVDAQDMARLTLEADVAFGAEGPLPDTFGGVQDTPANNGRFTIPANLHGNPGISVPVGQVDGLPVGMQIMAPHHHESWLLDAAWVVERERPWPLTAPA